MACKGLKKTGQSIRISYPRIQTVSRVLEGPIMTPRRLAVLFPEKAIPDWVARPVQSSTAVQRARGEFLAFWGAEMRPLLCDVPMGVRTARSPSRPSSCGRTVVTQRRRLSRRCVPYRVGTRPASSVWYALTADLTGRPKGLEIFRNK
jgi:hypothetical protein